MVEQKAREERETLAVYIRGLDAQVWREMRAMAAHIGIPVNTLARAALTKFVAAEKKNVESC